MIIKPRIRGFICTTAHPVGCAALTNAQIASTRNQPPLSQGARHVLVIGGSGGYGLASRVVAAFAMGARTLCLSLEKAPEADRTGSAGWYNNLAFDRTAAAHNLYARSLNADAFADATKDQVSDIVRRDFGRVDLLVYSLASPVRTDPATGALYRSAIKPVARPVRIRTLNVDKGLVHEVDLEPASDEEIHSTVKVMGGEDWERWVAHLQREELLAPGFKTVAYTYIGSELTWPIYWEGTLGKAKEDLDRAAAAIRQELAPLQGDARVAVLKATVTQASAAIPAVPLYISLLMKVMKEQAVHEDNLRHIDRLFRSELFNRGRPLHVDGAGRWRVDDYELRDDIQEEVRRRWSLVTTENLALMADITGFRNDFLRIFGFAADGVDYEQDVSPLGGD